MSNPVLGLHHVTATVDEAQQDLDFCLEVLGLRLVKKTVNFDNHHVYHFYYGDERGTPGTIWTTFPYHGRGVPAGKRGAGQITVTSFSVPAASLDFWRARLRARGLSVQDVEPRFGEESILVVRDDQEIWDCKVPDQLEPPTNRFSRALREAVDVDGEIGPLGDHGHLAAVRELAGERAGQRHLHVGVLGPRSGRRN